MSYNIDTWRTKVLEGIQIPVSAVPARRITHTLEGGVKRGIHIRLGEDEGIIGHLTPDNKISVTSIDCSGEGSGTDYAEILVPLLELSRGKLEAVLVWEGGDSITRLKANDGQVIEEEIEL